MRLMVDFNNTVLGEVVGDVPEPKGWHVYEHYTNANRWFTKTQMTTRGCRIVESDDGDDISIDWIGFEDDDDA